LAIVDRGDVYAENSGGPRTDPWGTPTEHEVTADQYEPIRTDCCGMRNRTLSTVWLGRRNLPQVWHIP